MKPVMLIILDGYGIGKDYPGNAALLAKKPTLDRLDKTVPKVTLRASEEYVGLPKGQMGNSEVGHLNIGAGRVIYQELTKITKSIEDGDFFKNEELLKTIEVVKNKKSTLHLMGLVSKGGVHSHMDHLKGLLRMAKENEIYKVYVHALLDGRDVSPTSGIDDIKELEAYMTQIGVGKIATICGRYYGMDRDRRWERTKKYYDLVVEGVGESYDSSEKLIMANYQRDITDEFIMPGLIDGNGLIKDDDALIFFNFRPDRARQIIRPLADSSFLDFERKVVNIYVTIMTQYDKTIPNTHVVFKESIPENTLGEVLSKNNLRQLRIAETEKYPHVTFFFNGGREIPFEGEDRVLVQSPKVATYDLQPEMSAYELCDNVLDRLNLDYDCIILNFANPDMVGHTGSIPAAIKAVETVDECLGRILNKLDEVGGAALITADHGNCEVMLTDEGQPVTSHTTNLVPLYLYGVKDKELIDGGALCDLAPSILALLGVEQPSEMIGKSLIKEKK